MEKKDGLFREEKKKVTQVKHTIQLEEFNPQVLAKEERKNIGKKIK